VVSVFKRTIGFGWSIGPLGPVTNEIVWSRTTYPTEVEAVLALLTELEKAPLWSGRDVLGLPRPQSQGHLPES
jgi:hypothetical protein